jgi:hypothetical protein
MLTSKLLELQTDDHESNCHKKHKKAQKTDRTHFSCLFVLFVAILPARPASLWPQPKSREGFAQGAKI